MCHWHTIYVDAYVLQVAPLINKVCKVYAKKIILIHSSLEADYIQQPIIWNVKYIFSSIKGQFINIGTSYTVGTDQGMSTYLAFNNIHMC